MRIGTVLILYKWLLMAQDKIFRDCIIQRGFSVGGSLFLYSMQDPSSPTRDGTLTPSTGCTEPWTTREVPREFLNAVCF